LKWTLSVQIACLGTEVPEETAAATELAQEVEMQWEMFLANTYALAELQHVDFSRVHLPHSWFTGRLA
jgi:hypothetical protein